MVSYALPALIAIGYARSYHVRPIFPLNIVRRLAWRKTSRLLREIQPSSGGYLEATPLTSFVTMALASSGQKSHPVVPHAVQFLQESMRDDGSWLIDTNLATWGTTLASKALLVNASNSEDFPASDRRKVAEWVLGQQYVDVHPFTCSPPGGWAWTDLPGGVPDADDTPGAMLALKLLADNGNAERCRLAAANAAVWLANLQNRDGGIPTFCRGWGTLPFDRSSPDLTAHTIRAWLSWLPEWKRKYPDIGAKAENGISQALRYLEQCQDSDGAWTPLWFGNQHVDGETNRTYGTAHVLMALAEVVTSDLDDGNVERMRERGLAWLLSIQDADSGGWGGDKGTPCSIEETSLAVIAALACEPDGCRDEMARAAEYLITATDEGRTFPVSPIGFYFAKLWYHERLYPMVWSVEALERLTSTETVNTH